MSRREFTKPTKRLALKRAEGRCEASGDIFGLEPGQRCSIPLSNGVRFEHVDPDANSKDNSLENCAAVCIRCWRYKTDHYDKPLVAKTLRQQDKDNGIRKPTRLRSGNSFRRHTPKVRDINADLTEQ